MSKSQLITVVVSALLISACASSSQPYSASSGRPHTIECVQVAPIGSRIKSKTVCGRQGVDRSFESPQDFGKAVDPMDFPEIGSIPGGH